MVLEMERAKITRLVLIAAFLAVITKSNCQFRQPPAFGVSFPAYPAPRPLCLSQFLLVNHACSKLPYAPVPPPSPTSPPPPSPPPPSPSTPPGPPAASNGHRHGHHHRHRHGGYHETPAEEECCRWLKEVDTQCVCDLLVYLPAFLAKPRHNYTVTVAEDCSVTYQCPSRVIV